MVSDKEPVPLTQTSGSPPSFGGNVLLLIGGSTITQILTFLAAPIITRLYSPEAYGIFALFTTITGIIGAIVCLRYEIALMLPESDEEAGSILIICIIIASVMSCATSIILWFFGNQIAYSLKASVLNQYFWVIPIVIFISGIFLTLNYWALRTKLYPQLAIASVSFSVMYTGTQLWLGITGFATGGSLILANAFGQFTSCLILGVQVLTKWKKTYQEGFNWTKIKNVFFKNKKFLYIDSFSTLLNIVSWQLPVILLAMFFSPEIVGLYALSLSIQMPLTVIGNAIQQVFFQSAVEAKHKKTLTTLTTNTLSLLIAVSLIPCLLLTVSGRDIFVVFFGSNWALAGTFTQILGPFIFINFLWGAITFILPILNRLEIALNFNIINFLSRFFSIFISGMLFHDPLYCISFFAIAGMLVYSYYSLKVLGLIQISKTDIGNILFPYLKIAIPLIGIFLILYLLNASALLIFFVSIAALCSYFLYSFRKNPPLYLFLKGVISKR